MGCKGLQGSIVTKQRVLSGEISSSEKGFSGTVPGTLELHYNSDAQEYTGPYEVTPAAEVQTLETAGKIMKNDIKVNKIPENYGLISYNQDRIITIT